METHLHRKAFVQIQDHATKFWTTWSDSAKVIDTDDETYVLVARFDKTKNDYVGDQKKLLFNDPFVKILWK